MYKSQNFKQSESTAQNTIKPSTSYNTKTHRPRQAENYSYYNGIMGQQKSLAQKYVDVQNQRFKTLFGDDLRSTMNMSHARAQSITGY